MNVKKEQINGSRIKLFFNFDWTEFEPFYKKALDELRKNLKLPGFRDGMVPPEIAKEKIGEKRITDFGIEMLVNEKYREFIKDNKIEIIGQPKFELVKIIPQKELSFNIEAGTMPKISLPNYREIAESVLISGVKIDDKEVEESLEWLQKSRAKFEEKEGLAENGDFVEIEYSSPQIENGRLFSDKFYLGKGGFVPGFEDEIKEMKKGEKKEFSARFPEGDKVNQDLAGKEVKFNLELKNIYRVELAKIDDEFAKSLGKFNNLEELKKSIKEGIKKEKEIENIKKAREKILEKISKESNFDIPEELISAEKNYLLEELKENVRNSLKIPFDQYLKQINKTEEELKESMAGSAKEKAKRLLILREIGGKEGVSVSEEEINFESGKFLSTVSEADKHKFDIEKVREYYKEAIYNEKVFQILDKYVSNNTDHN